MSKTIRVQILRLTGWKFVRGEFNNASCAEGYMAQLAANKPNNQFRLKVAV